MRGIILAAGRGKRLESILKGRPKCLLEFGGTSIFEHQVSALAATGIRDFVVVVGYEKEQIIAKAGALPYRFTFVENPIYAETNTIYSLWLTRAHFDQDFVYCNADVLFDYRIAQRVADGKPRSAFACTSGRCSEEEVKIILDNGRIAQIGKDLDIKKCFGEFIGVARFAADALPAFSSILDECISDRGLWNKFFEYAVNLLAPRAVLRCADVTDLPAVEIDFPEDLERARAAVFPLMQTNA